METTAPSLSFDPARTKVVLIGLTECQDPKIPPLPSVKNNVDDLEKIIADPSIIGVPQHNIVKLLNPGLAELGNKVAQTAKEATDCFVVYYAGHGLKARRSEGLFLATKDSTEENCSFNSMNLQVLKEALESSNAPKRILVLDCCFSGEAVKGMGPESSLLAANIDIAGTFTLASSPATKISIAPEGATYTAFTGELIGLLQEGTGSEQEYLSLQEIYEHVKRRI